MDNQNNTQEETQVTVDDNTKAEEVKDTTASTGTPDLTQMSEADKRAFFAQELQKSAISSQLGKTDVIVVNEGTPFQYHMILVFPGTAIASQIEDSATVDTSGTVDFTQLMQGAIDNGVISFPQVHSLAFWDTHKGYTEAAAKVLNFLNQGLAGNLEQTKD